MEGFCRWKQAGCQQALLPRGNLLGLLLPRILASRESPLLMPYQPVCVHLWGTRVVRSLLIEPGAPSLLP